MLLGLADYGVVLRKLRIFYCMKFQPCISWALVSWFPANKLAHLQRPPVPAVLLAFEWRIRRPQDRSNGKNALKILFYLWRFTNLRRKSYIPAAINFICLIFSFVRCTIYNVYCTILLWLIIYARTRELPYVGN